MACYIFLNQQVQWKYALLTAFESLSVTLEVEALLKHFFNKFLA